MINTVFNEDCLITLKRMRGESIAFICTSPPYNNLRSYKGYHFDFDAIAIELFRVIEKGGVLAWIVGDSIENGSETLIPFEQALKFKEIGFNVHDVMIYQKKNFSNPEKNRYHQIFEYCFILSKGKPKTFNPIKDRKNICSGKIGNVGTNTVTQVDGSKKIRSKKIVTEYGMRYNIWSGLTAGQENFGKKLPHPAMMPAWLVRDLILSWSNPGDLIYDPMAGSGTTGLKAKELGRNYILSEISEEYCKIIKERLS